MYNFNNLFKRRFNQHNLAQLTFIQFHLEGKTIVSYIVFNRKSNRYKRNGPH